MGQTNTSLTENRAFEKCVVLSLFALFVSAVAFHVFFGEHDVDEGFYAYASRWVCQGHRLYQDFHFTQVPIVPYVYGLFFRVVGASLIKARILSAVFGCVAVGLALMATWRKGGRLACVFVSCALCLNVVLAYNYAIVKTYSLASLFFMLGVAALLLVQDRPRACLWATTFLSLAALTRLTLAACVPVILAYVGLAEGRRLKHMLPSLLVALFLGCLFVGSHAFPDVGRLLFGLLGVHVGYGDHSFREGAILKFLMLQRVSRDFGLLLGIFVGTLGVHCAACWLRIREQGWRDSDLSVIVVGLMTLLAIAVHVLPYASVSEYVVVALPCAAVYVACAWTEMSSEQGRNRFRGPLVVVLLAAFAGTGFHRATAWFDWTFGGNHMQQLAQASAIVRRYTNPGDPLLSTDRRLAVDTGTEIPHQFIMNNFLVPEMSDSQAQRFHMANSRVFADIIRQWPADVVVFGAAPRVDSDPAWTERVAVGYREVGSVPDYGPYHGDVRIYVRESPSDVADRTSH